ncbi:hypothetical protein EVAR_9856_1 [Eumeta japonica]|uniref:Uncharacterized protein n=1 Tax=Eumeta variegata TaxID=151549 RepID=A0A4C1TQE6_EUMVA|nr:hypothetical protein EVAR_9856_1 [Eumeta japonica]
MIITTITRLIKAAREALLAYEWMGARAVVCGSNDVTVAPLATQTPTARQTFANKVTIAVCPSREFLALALIWVTCVSEPYANLKGLRNRKRT